MTPRLKVLLAVLVVAIFIFFITPGNKKSDDATPPSTESAGTAGVVPTASDVINKVAAPAVKPATSKPAANKPAVKEPVYTSVVRINNITGPSAVAAGQQGSWVVVAETPGTEETTYSAIWGDGSPKDMQRSNVLTHLYTKPGVYVITFSVMSTNSKLVSEMKSVNVVAR